MSSQPIGAHRHTKVARQITLQGGQENENDQVQNVCIPRSGDHVHDIRLRARGGADTSSHGRSADQSARHAQTT